MNELCKMDVILEIQELIENQVNELMLCELPGDRKKA